MSGNNEELVRARCFINNLCEYDKTNLRIVLRMFTLALSNRIAERLFSETIGEVWEMAKQVGVKDENAT